MIRAVEHEGKKVLDIPELRKSRQSFHDAHRKKYTDINLNAEYCHCLNAFFDWYIQYCSDILGNKPFTTEQVCQAVFREDINTKLHNREYIVKSLYISKEYVQHLKQKVAAANLFKYEHTLISLLIDLEFLIAHVEVNYKKAHDGISPTSWRRKILTPRDIYSSARTLFSAEEFNNIEDLYLADLKPVVMFQIRQLLEIYVKNLIGYYAIVDDKGEPIKKFTQVGWEFVKQEVKKSNSRIGLPFDIHSILAINNWSQGFVHSSFVHNSYIQFFALKAIGVLFKPSQSPIQLYNGKRKQHYDFAEIKITKYNSLKADFEAYLRDKSKTNLKVKWIDVDYVGAYIISL